LRARTETAYDELGPERAHALLARRDPEAAAAIHPNDRRRVVRALELGALGASLAPERDRLWTEEYRHPTLLVGLDVARDELARRIETRTREMWERGAEEEARAALRRPLSTQARQAIGLREVEQGLAREEAIASVVRRTRAYARRQRVWLRRIPGLVSVEAARPPAEVADAVLEMARARERLPADGGR
jgi:tRNA dimethylallyltransferase